jgi:hypothetical protein
MSNRIKRRQFISTSLAVAGASVFAAERALAAEDDAQQEFYELRVYRCESADKRSVVGDYLQHALVPALARIGLDRIGVFTSLADDDFAVYALLPYPTLAVLANINDGLAADSAYQDAARDFFAIPKSDPAYSRIESRLMKAFAGMPVIELPSQTSAGESRILELRIYESHNEDKARRKVAMFNDGEIDIMREVKLAPVFFGETLISSDVPNLTYMLSGADLESHQQHWKAFLAHPEWDRMKKMDKYKDTVSKINKVMLQPTEFSQI